MCVTLKGHWRGFRETWSVLGEFMGSEERASGECVCVTGKKKGNSTAVEYLLGVRALLWRAREREGGRKGGIDKSKKA
ncbi:uncharacterized protein SPSK_10192 [Sporothrix schenckii 1099-18]|uniref:Uncharacterized protein n=1 Tax=Sporothrix schenckii 1099-18 TaxID=1397361 RepID=A0A0F2M497_SPOSC|nr:uncharacterized protein SPSK_10192 [Sporothrix schenckii 1099-18]KJR84528.1 hypothetical protein SPSK_10192 [Sporothrix schenckii 1099-18]